MAISSQKEEKNRRLGRLLMEILAGVLEVLEQYRRQEGGFETVE